MSDPTVFGPEATEQIAKTVREVARRMKNETPVRGRWQHQPGGGTLELFHGVIVEQCDPTCSTYKVQRIHRYLIAGCDDCGSGSGSGS
jgi:hypothetical protein